MQPLNQSDLRDVAARLSGPYGTFGLDNLVSYGMTAIVKPGAITSEGYPVTGEQVQAALGGGYQVFPLAIEYAPDAFDQEIVALDGELESFDREMEAPESFGGAKGLQRRYLRVVARYRKCMTKLGMKGKRGRARRCDRRFRSIQKRWAKMQRKGFSAAGLPSPEQIRAEFASRPAAPQRHVGRRGYAPQGYPQPVQAPAPGGYVPTSREVSPYYLADQAALEREVSAFTPGYGCDQDDLSADLRADTLGYLFSGVEHDYFGLDGDVEVVLSQEDQEDVEGVDRDLDFLDFDTAAQDEQSDLPDDDDDLLAGIDEEIGGEDDDFGDDDLGDDGEEGDDEGDPDEEDGEEGLGADDDDDFGESVDEVESEIQKAILGSGASKFALIKNQGQIKSLMAQRDDLVRSGQDTASVDGQLTQILIAAGARPEAGQQIRSLVAERDALIRSGISGEFGDDDEFGLRARRRQMKRARRQLEKKGEIRPMLAKKLAKTRAKLQEQLTSGKGNAQKVQARLAKIDEVLNQGSANNGIDYGRVRPKSPGKGGEDAAPVIVIAIRKRGGEAGVAGVRNQAVAAYGAVVGYEIRDPGLVDVFAADLFAVNQGFSPLEASYHHRQHVDPTSLVHGEDAMGGDPTAFPMGAAAPFPGPRRAGKEVY